MPQLFVFFFPSLKKQNDEFEFLKAENQKLRDEINLLKGEQTKPKIRGSKKNEDISSEKERTKTKASTGTETKSKLEKI